MAICPKNKSSKGRRDKRRSPNYKMKAPTLVKCSHCGALSEPHKVCKACGYYNKKSVVAVED
ncbi:MAG: 50S ribosomal protein L32 [Lachnospiraceae bacterium]|nr:50S ribosomal protein L32 [Lachnospiraceae bacterium]